MKVLITGGAGYIGCVLSELLLDAGHEVTVLDRMFFGDTLAHLAGRRGLTVIRDDIRWFAPALLAGHTAVLDLAAISNDPAGELDPAKTLAINAAGRARVAGLARGAGVQRYVLASSCSVYGFADGELTEASPTNPLTTYAAANLEAERACLPLAGDGFCVSVLRQATVYGVSARMRFDLAINGMTRGLHDTGVINVLRDGTQWRPFVHVRDTARAFLAVLEAPPARVNGQTFNVGSDDQNYQILPLAERVCAAVGRPPAHAWYGAPDHRSYRVSFARIRDVLGFAPRHRAEDGAREIHAGLAAGTIAIGPETSTVAWYRELMRWHGVLGRVVQRDAIL